MWCCSAAAWRGSRRRSRSATRAMSSVRQNLGIIVVPNAIAIALGALGLIGPPLAAVINNGATILAVLVGTLPLLKIPHASAAGIRGSEPSAATDAIDAPASTIECAVHRGS